MEAKMQPAVSIRCTSVMDKTSLEQPGVTGVALTWLTR
jgi:hypothetical protein